jgi:transcription termination/antitermination protein NusG
MKKYWLVFYTKSRQEKKVRDMLERNGFTTFLPIQRVMRQWSDRKKKVEVPLFNSYIFVFDSEDRIPAILQTPGIAWNIRHNDKPAKLHENELQLIKRFLDSGYFLETSGYDRLPLGTKVKVIDGPLKGAEGLITDETKTGSMIVLLESIGQSIRVQIEPQFLKEIN